MVKRRGTIGERVGGGAWLKGLMRVHNSCRKCGQVRNWIGHGDPPRSYRLAILANVVTSYRGAICDEVANAWIDLHCSGCWDASNCIRVATSVSTDSRMRRLSRCRVRLIEHLVTKIH